MATTAESTTIIEETQPFKQNISDNANEEQKHPEIEENTSEKCKCWSFCGSQGVIHPYGAFKIVWDIIVSIVIIISAIEIPLTLAFDIPIDFSTTIGVMAFCIDIFLCCDICVTFRTAYYDEWDHLRLIVNPKLIATRYATGWFTFDLITSFPFDFVFNDLINDSEAEDGVSGMKILRMVRLFRLLRVFRIYKMMGIMREMNRLFPTMKKWLGIGQVMICMLFVAHYFACIWFAVGKENQEKDEISWLEHANPPIDLDGDDYNKTVAYVTSLYWSIVTLFTTGYGDITAYNTNEKWVAMFVVVVGSIMTAYLVGTLTVLAFEGDKREQYTEDKLDEVSTFGAFFNLSNTLIRAITAHIEYHCKQNYVASDPNEFLKSLPQHLRSKAETEIASRSIGEVDIFKNLSDAIIGNTIVSLVSIGCNSGYKLYSEGEESSEIYLMRLGCARLYFGKNNPNHAQGSRLIKRGDVCGEKCIISHTRSSTLVCETWCEFYMLRRETLKESIWDHLSSQDANRTWEQMKEIITNTPHVQRRIEHRKSAKLLKARAKAKIEDTIYDDLFSVPNTKKNGFVNIQQQETKTQIEDDDDEGEGVAGIVDKMRNMSRVDSGLQDLKMKQHYKRLREKGDQMQQNDVQLTSVNHDSGTLNIIVDDEDDEEHI